MFRTAGYRANEDFIQTVITECGRIASLIRSHVSVANAHFPPYPGYAVYLDVVYLKPSTGHQFPFLLIFDSFSRFIVCVPSKSLKSTEMLSLFGIFWMQFLGRPRYMIRDGGPVLIGNAWAAYGAIYNVAMVCSHTNQPSQMGAIERDM